MADPAEDMHLTIEGWEEPAAAPDGQEAPPEEDALIRPNEASVLRVQRTARILGVLAVLAVLFAILLNALWVMQWGPRTRTFAEAARGRSYVTRYEPSAMPQLAKPAVDLLTPTVIGYETIARHAVPGGEETKAEAVYASLNMDVTIQVPVSIYAYAEGFSTPEQARAALQALAAQFPQDGRQAVIEGLTPAYIGFMPEDTGYVVAWVRDVYLCFVKTTFLRHPPAERRKEFLKNSADPIAVATDVYQRTGKSGIEMGTPTGGGVQ